MKSIRLILSLCATLIAVHAQPRNFSLESPVDGKMLKSSDLRGKFVALHFLLKTECPFCLKHTHNYATKASSLPNVVQVFVKPDTAEEIKSWATTLNSAPNFPRVSIYRDPAAKLADEFKIPTGYKFHGETIHFPALVLLDPQGLEVFRYVGKNNGDRYSFERLSAKIAEISGKSKATVGP